MKPPVVPCKPNDNLNEQVKTYADELRVEAHLLGSHGLDEKTFYESGIFEGAIQRIRGQLSASMGEKHDFVRIVFGYMQDRGFIDEWEFAGSQNRFDLTVILPDGTNTAVELKGCLDGNNLNISARPPHAEEFVVWSLCPSKSSNLRKGIWSGLHTRIGAESVDAGKIVDGLIVWDWICGTAARRCPKVVSGNEKTTSIGRSELPPPCLYALPKTVPSPRNNPSPRTREAHEVKLLNAFIQCFGASDQSKNTVSYEAKQEGQDVRRKTSVHRCGEVVQESSFTTMRRT